MKKRLEAELISIAHRVLKLKNKSEVDQLFTETQKLYEALSVLKFYGDYIERQPNPEVNQEELEEKLAESLEGKSAPKLDVEVQQQITKEKKEIVPVDEESEASEEAQADEIVAETPEVATEEKKIVGEINVEDEDEEESENDDNEDEETELSAQITEEENEAEQGADPIFEMAAEGTAPDQKETPSKQISFEDFLGDYKELEFVKPNDITPTKAEEPKETPKEDEPKKDEPETEKEPAVKEPETEKEPEIKEPAQAPKPVETPTEEKPKNETNTAILNEKLATGINIGLNDRVGFVKYLFDGSNEDFNRVLSQLNTFDSYAHAEEFITDMVKPDYNNWKGQDEFSERFMDIVKQKFQ